ncbi:MAG TPA: NusG domain II-containing protein [Fibrobacteria bacterium]|nr:NusG domain II-containing protein [Fibrobacteria bacterium]
MSAVTMGPDGSDRSPNRFLRPLDVVIVVVVTALGIWSTARLFGAPSGTRAVIWVDGRRAAWVPLGGETSVDSVRGTLGAFVVEHGHGRIRVLRSPCPGKICQKQGGVHRVGDKLVCVPSHVVVVVESESGTEGDLDAVP